MIEVVYVYIVTRVYKVSVACLKFHDNLNNNTIYCLYQQFAMIFPMKLRCYTGPFKFTVMKERLLSDSVQTVYDQGQWLFITLKDVPRRKSDTLLD